MTSWRDTVTERAQADLDGLTKAAVDLAVESIRASGEFRPFALAVTMDGERTVIAPDHPASTEVTVVEQLAARWRAVIDVKDSLRAAAVALNVALTEHQGDGIEISIEHREGASVGLIFPYTIGTDGTVELEPASEHAMNPRIWGSEI